MVTSYFEKDMEKTLKQKNKDIRTVKCDINSVRKKRRNKLTSRVKQNMALFCSFFWFNHDLVQILPSSKEINFFSPPQPKE